MWMLEAYSSTMNCIARLLDYLHCLLLLLKAVKTGAVKDPATTTFDWHENVFDTDKVPARLMLQNATSPS
jgi:hypothetical protein